MTLRPAAAASEPLTTRTGRTIPLYLDEEEPSDNYSYDSLTSSRSKLDVLPASGREFPDPGAAPVARPDEVAAARQVAYLESVRNAEARIADAPQVSGPAPGTEVMAADSLHGDRVINLQRELIGKIRGIMLDVHRGRIAYAVLSSGGVMGVGDRLHAVPWSALTPDAEPHCFVLDISLEHLKRAPGFDGDCWPSIADPEFARSVQDHFGRTTSGD